MKCCKECFWDIEIRSLIQMVGNEDGNCDFCGSYAPNVDPKLLRDMFEFVKEELFKPSENGQSLADCFQEQFQVFNTQNVNNISRLLASIFSDDEDYVSGNFELSVNSQRLSDEWELLREELISKNRFFPKTDILTEIFRENNVKELKVFEHLISQLKRVIPIDYQLYRARVTDKVDNFRIDLDKPPNKRAGDGRANPVGISYLYCAGDEGTAVTEVRPSTGGIVHVVDIKTRRSVDVLDLTNPRRKFSPFQFADSDSLLALECIVFLEKLSDELSLPIAESRNLNYLPTQFFCEFIKSKNIVEGILFNSSFTGNENFVFFCEQSDEIVNFEDFRKVEITETKHTYRNVG